MFRQLAGLESVFKSRSKMNPTHTDQSVYQALDATIPQIRVLTLHQVSEDQELRCTLKTVSLIDQPVFHALSYVWGSGTEKDSINIHGHVVQVTSNLVTVLRHFCAHHYNSLQLHSLPLWIDAICINQADVEERSQQVHLMGKIFRQASRVLLWIGEGDEHSDHAFDRINDATFRDSCGELKTNSRAPTLDELRVKVIIERNLEIRRYWTRTWILQEIVLATQDPIMLCGSRRIFWSWYMQCKRDLPGYDLWSYPHSPFDWETVESEVPFHQDRDGSRATFSGFHQGVRHLYHEYGPIILGVALFSALHLGATDPRDNVYAVLGLVSQQELYLVDIDYNKTPERVFKDTMAAIWTSATEDLTSSFIPEFNFGPLDEKLDLPSWVPDFSRPTLADDWHARCLSDNQSGRWRPGKPAEIHIEGDILTVKAFKFDSITEAVKLDFCHRMSKTFKRGKASQEVDTEPLENLEVMAERGRRIPIPVSSRLAPFSVLRDRTPIWSLLTNWDEDSLSSWDLFSGGGDGWLPGVPRDRPKLWEILLGRQQIPEAWKTACSPELQNNLPALEAAILQPLLSAIERKADGKKVVISPSGFRGLATKYVEAGDVVVFIVGMNCMYVLRPFRDGYRMVGFANISGLMNWDDLDEAMRAGSLHEEELRIY